MKSSYRPDGWLGILVSGKIYVDFTKVDFNTAYQRLINEINRHRTNTIQIETNNKQIQHELTVVDLVIKTKLNIQQPTIKNYPTNINEWTTDHVQAFLINEKLEILLLVLSNMNRCLIRETYKRCKAYWEFMFQTYKNEVQLMDNKKTLTIYTYIRFLDEIEKYIPTTNDHSNKSSQQSSSICSLF